jgi:signal transduction histidine kinase
MACSNTRAEARLQVPFLRRLASKGWTIAVLSVVIGAALVTVGWFDYSSTRREFGALVRAQAASARDTVAAAARANRAAATEAREQLAERLLDNARLLAEIDRLRSIDRAVLEDIATRNHLFRITVLAPDASREFFVVPGSGGRGYGPGGGFGPGGGGGGFLTERLLRGGEAEVVSDVHEGRRAGAARLAAGVRRARGGAILISVDATDVANLQRQSSLDALLSDIVRSTDDIAYIAFEDSGVQRAQGTLPDDFPASAPADAGTTERRLDLAGRPVLELGGPVDTGGTRQAYLRLGMRLDRLQSAERSTAVRLVISLFAAAALGVLAIGLVWFRGRFGALSIEHALAQEALRRRDRLAAMGELASTVAHEVRNPLNAIAMSAQRLRKECLDIAAAGPDEAADARELVDVIQAEAQRINGKVQQFLEFARPPALNRTVLPVRPWLGAIVGAVRPLAESRHIELRSEVGDQNVVIDSEQMRQAIENLLRNALEATPEGGEVSLRAQASARECTIEVRDTGTGIDPAHLSKIFDLYFTTKRNGTGIGLAVTQQIVAAHGGTIEVDSAPGRGTTMRIRIPVSGDLVHA